MAKLTVPVRKHDHVQGSDRAPIVLVEYGDFECPHCGRAHGIVKELQEQMESQLCLVYRHFPLSSLHPHAQAAALASEAADAQGKFWDMHDVLFENQESLEDENLRQYARELDLDLDRFERDAEAGRFLPRVQEDVRSGIRSGVNGTPTFFINGVRYDGSFELPGFTQALMAAEAKHGR